MSLLVIGMRDWRPFETYNGLGAAGQYIRRALVALLLWGSGGDADVQEGPVHLTWWIDAIGSGTEARFINRLFGLYA